jgi:hypothetical protein
VTASVNVPSSCGLDAGDNLNFGSVQEGETSDVASTTVKNTGNTLADVDVSGSDWSDGDSNSFDAGNTEYRCVNLPGSGCDVTTFTSLTETPTESNFAQLDGQETLTGEFKVNVPEGQPAGSYSQTITFTADC